MKRFFQEINEIDSEFLPTLKDAVIDFLLFGSMIIGVILLFIVCIV